MSAKEQKNKRIWQPSRKVLEMNEFEQVSRKRSKSAEKVVKTGGNKSPLARNANTKCSKLR